MIRFVWCALLLTACGASQLPAGSTSMSAEQTEDSRLSKVPTIDLFGWGVRGEDGRQYDSIQTLEEAMRPQLDPILSIDISDSAEARRQLRAFALQLLTVNTTANDVVTQQGQLKQHEAAVVLGSSQAIRSITRSRVAKNAHCYEMRKVFTEARQSVSAVDEAVLESWRKWGIEPDSERVGIVSDVSTKAFLLLDLADQLTRLYIYEESDGVSEGELTEIVIQCPISEVKSLAKGAE